MLLVFKKVVAARFPLVSSCFHRHIFLSGGYVAGKEQEAAIAFFFPFFFSLV